MIEYNDMIDCAATMKERVREEKIINDNRLTAIIIIIIIIVIIIIMGKSYNQRKIEERSMV
jgi:hypothetical protein